VVGGFAADTHLNGRGVDIFAEGKQNLVVGRAFIIKQKRKKW